MTPEPAGKRRKLWWFFFRVHVGQIVASLAYLLGLLGIMLTLVFLRNKDFISLLGGKGR